MWKIQHGKYNTKIKHGKCNTKIQYRKYNPKIQHGNITHNLKKITTHIQHKQIYATQAIQPIIQQAYNMKNTTQKKHNTKTF